MSAITQDLFAEARDKFTITDAWKMLGLDGEPKSSCKSPFREDRHPSFSIFDGDKAWCDHSTGIGGDVVEFIRHAIGGDHKDVRQWLQERIGGNPRTSPRNGLVKVASKPQPVLKKEIEWPAFPEEGNEELWSEFAASRKYSFPAVHAMVQSGILRFLRMKAGLKCYVVTDASYRAAEIRRLDGKPFGEHKAYPLSGVDKSWLPGTELLRDAPKNTAILITEGATDLLTAIDIYSKFRRNHGGKNSWQPIALLGAGCKTLHPEAAALIKGRRVRLVPDGDAAGDVMADHWTGLLRKIGCHVDIVNLPRETDLTDHLSTLSPTDLFSL